MITVFSPNKPITLTKRADGSQDYTFDVLNTEVTDGYHTIAELYDMRRALTVQLFNTIAYMDFEKDAPHTVKSKLHNDGTMHEGYFIVATFINGKQTCRISF